MKAAVQFVLRTYKRLLSPLLPHSCRFVPTCSEYALEAVERYGPLRGGFLAAGRLLRCHPFARAGYDPVAHLELPQVRATKLGSWPLVVRAGFKNRLCKGTAPAVPLQARKT